MLLVAFQAFQVMNRPHRVSSSGLLLPMSTKLRSSIGGLLVAAGICFGGLAFGGHPPAGWSDYNTRLWQMEDGLPHNIVQAITQARDGYLWVGTREGLARFDGIRFQTIKLSPETPLLSITSLMQSRDGTLWIGTDSSGVFRLRGQQVERVSAPGGASDFAVQDIQEGGDGGIWIASTRRIFRWADGRMEQRAEFGSALQTLCVRSDGSVWTAGGGVLKRLDAEDTSGISPAPVPLPVRRLHCDQQGTFWVGAAYGLVQITNGGAGYFKKADGPSGFVSVILRDSAGTLWTGTYSGLSRFANGQFIDQGESDAPAYRVYAIYEDREQNLWVGSEEGLARLTPKVFQTLTKKDGLTLNTVATVCAAPGGGVWISAWGGGLNRWVDGRISSLSKSNGLSSNFIMAMCAGRDGSLWAGADYGAALNRF
jgi:ligand-binding sensor domain-containing protein